ncbi:MAG TPA: FecR domain-containing protein [Opitutaceae bacterium]
MKSHASPHWSRSDQDHAALWAARLDGGDLSPARRAELAAWLERKPARRALLSAYCQLSVELEQQLPALAERQPHPALLSANVGARRQRRWRGLAVAAGLAATLALGIGLRWRPHEPVTPATIATAPARRQSVTLADGTRADLNAKTTLRIDFRDRAQRLVRLDHGEALFTVAKDPERPFIVETPAGRIRVTGTVFNLRTDTPGQLEVTVLEGSVEVTPHAATEPLQLRPGDQVRLADGRLLVRRDRLELAVQSVAWREGQIVSDELSLGEAAARLSAYHDRPIEVAPEVASLRLGGRYSLDDLDGFLAALERVLPVRVELGPNGATRVIEREP